MASSAERQVAANERVETLARVMYDLETDIIAAGKSAVGGGWMRSSWELTTETKRDFMREFARRLLVRDLVRPGKNLPEPEPRQIEGQQRLVVDTPDGPMDANTGDLV